MNTAFVRQVGPVRWAFRYTAILVRRRLLRLDSEIRLPTGRRMLLPRHSANATEIFVTRADMDWGSEALFARFADPNRDFLDVGAHIGYYSSYLSPRVRRAFAFEPDQRNLPSLRANAALASNVEVVEVAVSSRDGEGELRLGLSSATNSLEPSAPGTVVSVRTTTIDRFVASNRNVEVGLIKTDIEGHDIQALEGAQRTVARFEPLILTECGHTPRLLELCGSWGYAIYAFTRNRRSMTARLRRMTGEDLQAAWWKMLFLVPPRLVDAFDVESHRHDD